MRRFVTILLPAVSLSVSSPGFSTTWHVPADAPTIQAGIDSAGAGDTVLVACGTYYEHDISMESSVILRSETGQPDCATIDAQGLGRVFYCDTVDSTARIEGFTVRGGMPSPKGRSGEGGGLYCTASSPVVTDCVFLGNQAVLGGGVVCTSDSDPHFTECWFDSNTATDGGGALLCEASSPTLVSCTFENNTAHAGRGGGILLVASSAVLTDCSFSMNSASESGAVHCQDSFPVLALATFCGNSAQQGGAMSVRGSSAPDMEDCEFVGNTATLGGAMVFYLDTCPVLTRCIFAENSAQQGGALLCEVSCPTLDECIFDGNSAPAGHGGALLSSGATVVLTRCTLHGNEAVLGGGIYCGFGSATTMDKGIIAFGVGGEAIYCDTTSTADLSCCDLYGNAGGDWVRCVAGQLGTNGNISADPMFCGVFVGDFMISDGSPCAPGNSPPGCDLIGALGVGCSYTPTGGEEAIDPGALYLGPPVPNPFNPTTEISYRIPPGAEPCRVSLTVYDSLGRKVRTLVDAEQGPGDYFAVWEGKDSEGREVASGVYVYRLVWRGESRAHRMVLLK